MKITLLLSLISAVGCTVQTVPIPGPQGAKGDQGVPGKDGVVDNATITDLQAKVVEMQDQVKALQETNVALQKQLNTLQNELASPVCPPNYSASASAPVPFLPDAVLCTNGVDEVVRVEKAGAAFWVDRFEASVWTTPDGPVSGEAKFASGDDTDPALFPKNGDAAVPMFALSVSGVLPSTNITWFQAAAACAASGKRLPTGAQWLRAALGTLDPDVNDGSQNPKCNTQAGTHRKTGLAIGAEQVASCVSNWGAEDLIGNIWEWTADWYVTVQLWTPDEMAPDERHSGHGNRSASA